MDRLRTFFMFPAIQQTQIAMIHQLNELTEQIETLTRILVLTRQHLNDPKEQ